MSSQGDDGQLKRQNLLHHRRTLWGGRMSSFTIQELKDLWQALNMSIDCHIGLDAPNKLKRLYELQDKIDKMVKEGE